MRAAPIKGPRAAVERPSREDIIACFDSGRSRIAAGVRAGPAPRPALVAAAVLVPLVERGDGTTVLLTRRSGALADHAGQVSFPGGRVEPEDADAEATALREAEEEIGLSAREVRTIGRLDLCETTTGFAVTPVVGLVGAGFVARGNPAEVAEVFEIPLSYVLDARNYQRRRDKAGGIERRAFALVFGPHFVWGATAGILVNLHERLSV